jgi:nucleotide sugar dehydrogenase
VTVAAPGVAAGVAPEMPYRVCVVGLGKIGLALAAHYAGRGMPVVGADIDDRLVAAVNRGEAPDNAEHGLAERVRQGHLSGLLRAVTDTPAAVRASNVVVVIVPLVVDGHGQPDFAALDAATRAVAAGLQPGALVIYETTLPLGTTRRRFGPMLEATGLRLGVDFDVAFSPERVLVGRIAEDLERYPKIVGGITPEATRRARAFYAAALGAPIIEMPDAETAEFVKLAETTYRDVNIGLANELARFAQRRGIDALAAFRAANTQPYSHLHTPSVGVGGHCIPVYPRFLLAQAGPDELPVTRQARRANDGMAAYAVDLLARELGGLASRRVLILGLAYRGGVKEASFSSALLLIEALRRRGARPLIHDPLFTTEELRASGAEPIRLERAGPIDGIIIQSDHAEYRTLDWSRFGGCRAVVDGRHVTEAEPVEAAGMRYVAIGRGASGTARG